MPEPYDPLGPARGCIIALAFSALGFLLTILIALVICRVVG